MTPELILTYFTTMSNLAKLVFCTKSKPRYQVSVYRAIGPLVLSKRFCCVDVICDLVHDAETIHGIIEPRHEKTNVLVSELVLHKPDCTVTEDG